MNDSTEDRYAPLSQSSAIGQNWRLPIANPGGCSDVPTTIAAASPQSPVMATQDAVLHMEYNASLLSQKHHHSLEGDGVGKTCDLTVLRTLRIDVS
ncbi:hypothetical protein Y032_0010g1223 [Ancylostoma ceylanicum]|uniref:Uncharacterized protein n=1 Tax=Ancylostoma ceylanicum TaxID=53326 RepID=A0A016VIK5_9BILA|nr:hypothetical protein Y032_0010g1223 [Ancylostoma ceylanicum]